MPVMSRSRPRVVSRCSFQTDSGVAVRRTASACPGRSRASRRRRELWWRSPSRGAPGPAAAHRRSNAADAAFAVGDGAVLFAPGGGGQQQVGVLRRSRSSRTLPARRRTRHVRARAGRSSGRASTARGWCRRSTSALICAIGGSLEHLDRGLARRGRHAFDAPQPCHLRAVFRGLPRSRCAGQQVGQAADLASAHRVGLAGQRERPGAGLADLPGGQVQVDQRGVLRRAAGCSGSGPGSTAKGSAGASTTPPMRPPSQTGEPACRGLHDVGLGARRRSPRPPSA